MAFSRWVVVLIIIVLVTVAGLDYIHYQNANSAKAPIVTASVAESDIIQNPVEVHSPDGKMKVVVDKKEQSGGSTLYTFNVSDISGTDSKTIFSKTLPPGQEVSVPENSFSPNNRYLFLKEKDTSGATFLVFKANGEVFQDGQNYIDVVSLFDAKKTGYKLQDVTGWDSDNLLHVFTVKDNGEKGPSFWFEIPDGAVIQLASR